MEAKKTLTLGAFTLSTTYTQPWAVDSTGVELPAASVSLSRIQKTLKVNVLIILI